MKTLLTTTAILASAIAQMNAALILGGDFQMYKPESSNTVTATFGSATSYAAGIGAGLQVAAGGTVTYSDLSAPGAPGGDPDIDMPGWTVVQGNLDLGANGMGGSTGLNVYAAWGGDGRIVTAGSVGTIIAGQDYTITSMVNGTAGTPIEGPIAFHLLANGVQLTPSSLVNPVGPFGTFQQMSRTYDAATLASVVGQSMTIVIGVENANDLPNRIIFDDVSLNTLAVPEPSVALLGGLGVLALLRRRRNA